MPKETVAGVIVLLILALVLAALSLQFLIYRKLSRRSHLKKELAELAPQKINAERYVDQLKDLNAKLAPLEKLVGNKDILWSQKLNEISDKLPRGVWLTKIQWEDGTLVLHGSAVSKARTEQSSVFKFNANLKESPVFKGDFSDMELEYIKSRMVSGTQVADFTIRADL